MPSLAEVHDRANGTEDTASPEVRILHEPLTYEARIVRNGSGFRAVGIPGRSYIQDLVKARKSGDMDAKERLERHSIEMRRIGEAREHIFASGLEYEFEQRAVSWTNGQGGYFAPPLWIIEHFAMQPTPERCLARLAPNFELPVGAQSVNLPAYTTGPDARPVQLDAPVPSASSTVDTAVSSAVVTIAGNYDVPLQMLEQSPQGAHLDYVAFETMEARYNYALEQQLIQGQGATAPLGSGNNQLLGYLNNPAVPTGNIINNTQTTPGTWFGVAGTGAGPLAQVIAAIGNNRKAPAECWMMTTSRGAWLASAEVSTLPLAVTNQEGPGKFDVLAYPVELNDAVPTTVNTNQDIVVALRPQDWLILESEQRTQIMQEPISGSLMVRLQLRRYAAALLRYPSSVAYLTGVGNVIPAGF